MRDPVHAPLAACLAALAGVAAFAAVPSPAGPPAAPAPAPGVRITARFSPKGGCPELVAWHVDRAAAAVFVGSYQWSSRPVHDAVLRARGRGVKVRVVLDPATEAGPGSLLPGLLAAGLTADEVRVDDRHAIFHDKVVLRDAGDPARAAVECGSFNFSASADRANAENAVVIEGRPDVAAAYLADLETHWAHARPARPKPHPPAP